jgi:hypothetical protein
MEGRDAESYADLLRVLAPVVDWAARLDGEPTQRRPERGSPMQADDERLNLYQISFATWHSLSHAVDHLNCLRALVHDARVLHMYAPYTLVRGALENACASVWMLQSPDRTERVLRRLRIAVNDISHGEEARALTGQIGPRTKAERLAQVRQIARQCGADEDQAVKTVGYKEIVSAAGDGNPIFVLAWKLCSGIAHGDFWTTRAAADMVPLLGQSTPPGSGAFAVSANIGRLVQMTSLAVGMTRRGWQLYDTCRGSPKPPT